MDFDIITQKLKPLVDKKADTIWSKIAKTKSPSAPYRDQSCEDLHPALYDYTSRDGRIFSLHVHRDPFSRKMSIMLINGQFEIFVPQSLSQYDFTKDLSNFYDWIETRLHYALSKAETDLPARENTALPAKIYHTCRDGRTMTITVQYSQHARKIRIKLQNNQFILVVPEFFQKKDLDDVLPSIFNWVEKKAPEVHDLPKKQSLPENVTIPLLGKNFTVSCEENYLKCASRFKAFDLETVPVIINCDRKKIMVANINDVVEIYGAEKDLWIQVVALQVWCQRLAERHLPTILKRVLKQKDLHEVKLSIRDQRTRWGSCTKRPGQAPSISLNWRAVLLPEELIFHLCVHEVSHLEHMNHSQEFYQTMEGMESEARRREKELDLAWSKLPWWATHKSQLSNIVQ